jgi:hypothetical protein
MAYNKNYYDNRMQIPKINLEVREWDYDALLSHLARVIGRPFTGNNAQVGEDIRTELKKLETHGWSSIVDVIESLMQYGKSTLNNNLWTLVLSAVSSVKKAKASITKGNDWFVPEWERSGMLLRYQSAINEEIRLWLDYAKNGKPLKYDGQEVVFKPEGLSPFTAEEILSREDFEVFKKEGLTTLLLLKYKSVGSWCVLYDAYTKAIHPAILKEYDKDNPDNNAMKDTMLKFINHLINERLKQTGGK